MLGIWRPEDQPLDGISPVSGHRANDMSDWPWSIGVTQYSKPPSLSYRINLCNVLVRVSSSWYLRWFNNIFRTNFCLTSPFRGVWKLTIIFSEQILTRSLFSPLSASLLHWPSDCRQQKKNPNPNAGFESLWTLLDKVFSDLPADGVVRIFSWVKAKPINLELASSCVCA